MIIYKGDKAITCDQHQLDTMLAAGYTLKKGEAEKPKPKAKKKAAAEKSE